MWYTGGVGYGIQVGYTAEVGCGIQVEYTDGVDRWGGLGVVYRWGAGVVGWVY